VLQKRLRIFAGPNGSGKSSLLERIPESVPLGYYTNADEIEKQIASNLGIPLSHMEYPQIAICYTGFLKILILLK